MIESSRLGGTCVNVGCVPKKVMFYAASLREEIMHDAEDYGLGVQGEVGMEWGKLVEKRDAYVERLNGIYQRNLDNSKVEVIKGWGKFVGENKVSKSKDIYLLFVILSKYLFLLLDSRYWSYLFTFTLRLLWTGPSTARTTS